MEAGKNSVIYMGLISGPNKADDTCGRTTVTGTMDRGFTVLLPAIPPIRETENRMRNADTCAEKNIHHSK
jgi:hypothetical protein